MKTEPRPPCPDVLHRADLQWWIDFETHWIATGRGDAKDAYAAFEAAEDAKYERTTA
jgi:hypothetical protein